MSSIPTDIKTRLATIFGQALERVAPGTADVLVEIERPRSAGHGDFSTNVALKLAKTLRKNPRDLASHIVASLPVCEAIHRAEVAGAGFINVFLRPGEAHTVIRRVLTERGGFGRAVVAIPERIMVEFVSANPTGPLHVGHGRGAAFGASLANILEAAGHTVSREYYVNDAGRQMDILALSTWLRYLGSFGVELPFPANAYQGLYVMEMARMIVGAHGERFVRSAGDVLEGVATLPEAERDDAEAERLREGHLDTLIGNAKRLLGEDYAYIHNFALTEQLGDCRNDLTEFGVTFAHWFSEKSLFDSNLVAHYVGELKRRGHVYLQDGAHWFRSTSFGDEKDRVIQRENGAYTYFASDIAYHANKFERGFDRAIDVWGADHHGYIARVKGALAALGLDAGRLTVALVQFAVLYRDGQKVSMSTRAGEFVTLRELRAEVGNDAARFFYVLRKSDQHLDFDLDLAKSQSSDNPVYYIQYAHARVASVLRQWGGDARVLADVDLSPLGSSYEIALVRRLDEYADVVRTAARELSPHLLAYHLRDLAGEFHAWYNAEQFLVPAEHLKLARLALVTATGQVIRNGLGLLGVSAPESM